MLPQQAKYLLSSKNIGGNEVEFHSRYAQVHHRKFWPGTCYRCNYTIICVAQGDEWKLNRCEKSVVNVWNDPIGVVISISETEFKSNRNNPLELKFAARHLQSTRSKITLLYKLEAKIEKSSFIKSSNSYYWIFRGSLSWLLNLIAYICPPSAFSAGLTKCQKKGGVVKTI